MEKEEEAGRRMDGKTILKSGRKEPMPAQLGQLKKGQGGM